MKKMSLAVILLMAAFLTACGSSSDDKKIASDCTPAHTFETVADGELTVSAYQAAQPFVSIKDGELIGIEGELINKIAEIECLSVVPMGAAAAASIPNVQNGRADVAVGCWYATKERAGIIDFINPIMTDEMTVISEEPVTSNLDDLVGKKVGSVTGYLFESDMKKFLGSDFSTYPSPTDVKNALKTGRIDVALDGAGTANAIYTDGEHVAVAQPHEAVAASAEPAQCAWPGKKGNSALIDAISEDLETLKSDGTLDSILTKYNVPTTASDTGPLRLIG